MSEAPGENDLDFAIEVSRDILTRTKKGSKDEEGIEKDRRDRVGTYRGIG